MTLVQTELKSMKIWQTSRLPAEYQEVKYIQGTWTQYINTWYEPNNNTEVESKINIQSFTSGNNHTLYWCRNASSWASRRAFALQIDGEQNPAKFIATIYSNTGSYAIQVYALDAMATNTDYVFKQTHTEFYINWVLQGTYSCSSYSVGQNLYLFANNSWWSVAQHTNMKLYYMKIKENWTLQREFIPCYRKADSVIWLYDLVNDVFYTNSWTWTFTKGNDVNLVEKEIKRVTIRPNGVEKQVYPATIPQDWLLWYRPLQEDLKDISWNGNDASWFSWTGSFSATANKTGARVTRSWDDSTQHIVTPVSTTWIDKTLFWWICFNAIWSYWTWLITNNGNYSSNYDDTIWLRPYDNYNIYARFHWNDNWLKGTGVVKVWNTPTAWVWYFWCMTCKSDGTLKFYINWNLETNTTTTFSSTSYDTTIYRLWCVFKTATGRHWTDWWVRHCGVYNRAISDAEVLRIYNITQ